MSLSYLQPVEASFTLDDYKPQQVGFQIQKHLYSIGLPDLSDVKIAFFCIEKNRQSFSNFRRHLYSLFVGNWYFSIADLGNCVRIGQKRRYSLSNRGGAAVYLFALSCFR